MAELVDELSPDDLIGRYTWLTDHPENIAANIYGDRDRANLFAYQLARDYLKRQPKAYEIIAGQGTLSASGLASLTPAGSGSSTAAAPAADSSSNVPSSATSTLAAGTSGMDLSAALNPSNLLDVAKLFPVNPFSPPQGVTLSGPAAAGGGNTVFYLIAAGLIGLAFFWKKLL